MRNRRSSNSLCKIADLGTPGYLVGPVRGMCTVCKPPLPPLPRPLPPPICPTPTSPRGGAGGLGTIRYVSTGHRRPIAELSYAISLPDIAHTIRYLPTRNNTLSPTTSPYPARAIPLRTCPPPAARAWPVARSLAGTTGGP
eukprot:1527736-Rhodomonas_salina.1